MEIFPEENKIVLNVGEMYYDYLVLATGTVTNSFGMKNIQENALPMKTVDDAINLRNYLLQQVEKATTVTSLTEKKKLTTVVVVGGGPTGVEIAGMIAEMAKSIFPKDYPELLETKGELFLIDGQHNLLAAMNEKSQKYTYKKLTELGVYIKLDVHVQDYEDETLTLSNGESMPTKMLIWAAGVIGVKYKGIPDNAYGKGDRLKVDAYNKVDGLLNIFAIGDICLQTTDINYPGGHPQMVQVAIQQGKNLAKNLLAVKNGKPLNPFIYFDKGSLAIIGRNKAVADLPKLKMNFQGFIAWIIWLFIHITYLVNHRNRVKTFYNWVFAYITKDQVLRMIIRPSPK